MTSINLSFRDIIYVTIYIVTVVSLIVGFRHRIQTLETIVKRLNRILYQEQGNLNVIDVHTCKGHRDNVYTAIRKGEQITDDIRKEMKILNENVLRIMIHLKIETRDIV